MPSAPSPAMLARQWAARSGGRTLIEVGVNFVGPYAVYTATKPHLGEVNALIASSAPPTIWAIVEFIRRRVLDAISIFVLAGIVLSLIAVLLGGSPRLLLLRERLVTGLIGAAFIVSALIDRPFILAFARASLRRQGSGDTTAAEARFDNPGVWRFVRRLTLLWGVALLLEAALSAALVFTLDTKTYLIAGPILGYAFAGVMVGLTFLLVRRRRRGAAVMAAQTEGASPVAPAEPIP